MDGSALEDWAVLQNKQPECKSSFLAGSLFNCTAGVTYFDNLLFIDTLYLLFTNFLTKDILFFFFLCYTCVSGTESGRRGGKTV